MSKRHNYREILLRKEQQGEDELVDDILQNPTGYNGMLFQKVRPLNENDLKRHYVEACLLASTDFKEIGRILDIDEELIDFYSKIYYITDGMDRLDKVQMANVRNKDESTLKLWGLTEGLGFLAWRLGKRADVTPPLDGLKQLFDTCLFKAKEAFFNSSASKASQESTKWVKLSMDVARLLKAWSTDGNEAQKELEIRVKEVVATFPSVSQFADLFEDVKKKQAEVELPIQSDEEISD